MKIPSHVPLKIAEVQLQNRLRQLSGIQGIDFISNDYLGLAKRHQTLHARFGAGGARLLSGNTQAHEKLETFVGEWFNTSALLFNSGYSANVGLLSALPSRHAVIFYDDEIHASCKDGLRLSLAKSVSFRHNDIEHLKEKIRLFPAEERYLLVESVYSMTGDLSPLVEMADICTRENIYLIVDEAHSFGIYGEQGQGLSLPVQDACVAIILPMGKAVGCAGALVVCSEEIKKYLINFSRAWIYSTALPPAIAEICLENIQKLMLANESREKLNEFMSMFKSPTPIISIDYSGNDEVKRMSHYLQQKGFAQKPILTPTVPKGKERIRIVLHSFNTTEEIQSLKNAINQYI